MNIYKSNTFPEQSWPYGGGETQPSSQGSLSLLWLLASVKQTVLARRGGSSWRWQRKSYPPLCEPCLVIQAKKKEMGGGLQNHKLVLEQPEHPWWVVLSSSCRREFFPPAQILLLLRPCLALVTNPFFFHQDFQHAGLLGLEDRLKTGSEKLQYRRRRWGTQPPSFEKPSSTGTRS